MKPQKTTVTSSPCSSGATAGRDGMSEGGLGKSVCHHIVRSEQEEKRVVLSTAFQILKLPPEVGPRMMPETSSPTFPTLATPKFNAHYCPCQSSLLWTSRRPMAPPTHLQP